MKIIYMIDTVNYIYRMQGQKSLKFLDNPKLTRKVLGTIIYFILDGVD